ncbi:MAG TPA: DegV family protein [Anaerolineales bacterium]
MEKPSRPRIAVVTDSAADLPPGLIEKYGIEVVPLILIMGARSWRDRVDISPAAFYELLKVSRDYPKTSQPNSATFQELFSRLSTQAEGIVVALVSKELSGTFASAQAAKESLPQVPIEVVDTRGVSMMEGYAVLAAAQAAAAGADLQGVANAARDMAGKCHVYFIIDTFEYISRGGRIGAAARLLGSALNIKPVLEIRNGIASPAGQARTRRKALNKVIELLEGQLTPGSSIHMTVVNVAAPQEALELKAELLERFHPVEILETDVSPVLGAHVGPGTVGVAYYIEA